ncbi:unnamed protein product [Acanthosepion pharaonis]|uniref:Uncharacterized protein n=1 Tax=Acanthosepion pharaonis TaxID=158019 RepID=A0A812CHS7_ACAPH|nr:unnamed protein product [Sepia pharaonis]
MVHVTGTKSSVLKTHLRVNTRSLFPWQQIKDAFVRNSRQEIRMMSSCDGQQAGRCRQNPENLRNIKDKDSQEVKSAKRTPVSRQQSTNPPRGWWIYVNGHRRGKKLMPSAQDPAISTPSSRTTSARTIIDDFVEYLTLKNRGALDWCLGK